MHQGHNSAVFGHVGDAVEIALPMVLVSIGLPAAAPRADAVTRTNARTRHRELGAPGAHQPAMPTISPWRACRLTPLIISRSAMHGVMDTPVLHLEDHRPDARRALRVTIGHPRAPTMSWMMTSSLTGPVRHRAWLTVLPSRMMVIERPPSRSHQLVREFRMQAMVSCRLELEQQLEQRIAVGLTSRGRLVEDQS